ncbi:MULTISPECIES: DUF106 domain-containing protein [Halococcus]|uniref:HTR-like protein n=1 Tax=Halococcus salifodinae DSM 8989 TaxID=1227456 RepID=M0MX92_9EURY|nr:MULTISPECIES: DUF106 domain-containing protein [Halococcus]EMA49943.1 HTR-like protein [Halococcus salifodinae DSM 8989]
MAETTGELRTLIERDDELADASAVVLAAAESGDGTVAWNDVSDDMTAAQWGRLLGTGVLIEAGDRFVIDDPVAVSEALGNAEDTTAENAEDTGWSVSDKIAGVSALTLALGYRVPVIRDSVGPMVDVLLTPLEAILPFYLVVLTLAAGTGLVSIVIQSRMTDYEQMGERQERMNAISERLEKAKERGDEGAVKRIQKEQMDVMTDQLGMFTQMLRPLAWTMLFTVPVLLWLYWLMLSPAQAVTPTAMVFPMLGRIAWTAKVIGPMQAWLLWYTICSVTSRQLIRRTLNIQTSPT